MAKTSFEFFIDTGGYHEGSQYDDIYISLSDEVTQTGVAHGGHDLVVSGEGGF